MRAQWSLAVDLGTDRVAAAVDDGGPAGPRPLWLSPDQADIASGVYMTAPGSTVAGHAAEEHGAHHPDGYLSAPRRAVGLPSVSVNGYDIDPAEPIAAVLREVLERALAARASVDGAAATLPDRIVLTHPGVWSTAQLQALHSAALRLGFGSEAVRLVADVDAAAHFFAATTPEFARAEVAAVLDVGAGSADAAIYDVRPLRRREVRRDELRGGHCLDTAVRGWVDRQLAASDPDLLTAVRSAGARDAASLSAGTAIARHRLQTEERTTIDVAVGEVHRQLTMSSDDLAELSAEYVHGVIDLIDETAAAAGVPPSDLPVLAVTGGVARAAELRAGLAARFRVVFAADPATAVASGALLAQRAGATTGRPAETAAAARSEVGSGEASDTSGRTRGRPGSMRKTAVLGVTAAVVLAGVAAVAAWRFADDGEQDRVRALVTDWVHLMGSRDVAAAKERTCPELQSAVDVAIPIAGSRFTVTSVSNIVLDADSGTADVDYEKQLPDEPLQEAHIRVRLVDRDGSWLVCGSDVR